MQSELSECKAKLMLSDEEVNKLRDRLLQGKSTVGELNSSLQSHERKLKELQLERDRIALDLHNCAEEKTRLQHKLEDETERRVGLEKRESENLQGVEKQLRDEINSVRQKWEQEVHALSKEKEQLLANFK